MRRSRATFTSVLFLAAGVLFGCKSESSQDVPVPGTITIAGGDAQSATAGSAVGTAPAVLVKDTKGRVMAGVPVTFAVTGGGGSVAGGAATTGADGVARAGGWTLGTTAGANTLTATAAGLAPVSFSATGTAGPAASLTVSAGANQTAAVNTVLPVAPAVTVRDANGNLVAGAPVTFAPAAGSGVVAGGATTSNANGVATVGSWTLGGAAGQHTLNVSSGAAATTVTATATGGQAAQPSKIVLNTGSAGGTVGQAVGQVPSVKVTDANNVPVPGVQVVFAISAGGGALTGATQTTDANGVAKPTSWTLGTTSGTQSITATVQGIPPLSIDVFAAAAAAAAVTLNGGDAQTTPAGWMVPLSPSVSVKDQFGNGVPNQQVQFVVAQGGGNLSADIVSTNSNGVATAGIWTLGPAAGVNQVTAMVGNLTPIVFNATASAPIPSTGYHITIRYLVPPNPRQQQAVETAVRRWQSVISADLSNVQLTAAAGDCGATAPAINQIVDDMLVLVDFSFIDGPGQILGQAGACFIRNSNQLPIAGLLKLDAADLNQMESNGTIDDVVTHEIGHTLGFSAGIFNQPLIAKIQNINTDSVRFTGALATAAFLATPNINFAGTPVPLENCKLADGTQRQGCGAGTLNSHWHEVVMRHELMTGYISALTNPMSAITVQAFADIGYTVNVNNAEPYTNAALMAPLRADDGGEEGFFLNEKPRDWTIKAVDSAGRKMREF